MKQPTPGERFRIALKNHEVLQVVGAINAISALQAERAGFRAIYLSGAGVANASHGLPDLGVTTLNDVLIDASRITAACSLPLLVDIDTGWGTEFTIGRAIRELERANVAGIHIEDQVFAKRCGHRPGKRLVSVAEMQARIQACLTARRDSAFLIMARTDAANVEGMDSVVARAQAYVTAGADAIFADAISSLTDFKRLTQAVDVPVLANMTEFGRTPTMTLEELKSVGVRMALYPLTAFRAMNAAAKHVYETLRRDGHQQKLLPQLQTRDELYQILNYEVAEKSMDIKSDEEKG
jgi:methylisocitrate lyase